MPSLRLLLLSAFFVTAIASAAQKPIRYRVSVDTTNRQIQVAMTISDAPGSFRIAAFAHPEYDDRYWRYIRNMKTAGGSIARVDSALWQVSRTAPGTAEIAYTVELPQGDGENREAWRPYIAGNSALIGGPHTFLYIENKPNVPAELQVELPSGWKAYSQMDTSGTGSLRTFSAANVAALMDAPILAGHLESRSFSIAGTHFTVLYASPSNRSLPLSDLARDLMGLSQEAIRVFGGAPFRHYYFLFQDDAYGGLEHAASTTIGIPADGFRENYESYLSDIAHEFLHAWNLMAMRPQGYGGVVWKKPGAASELWFSEGFTLYYADLLLRRAGLLSSGTRLSHFRDVMESYYRYSGNYRIAPRKVSLLANAEPGALGDYNASPHQQGEAIAHWMDWKIRLASGGKKNLDHAMRQLYASSRNGKPVTEKGLQRALEAAAGIPLDSFFSQFIAKAGELPLRSLLRSFGWDYTYTSVTDSAGNAPMPDYSLYAWKDAGGTVRLGINDPESCWGKAGLHTGDTLLRFNGDTMTTQRGFFNRLRTIKVGESVPVTVRRAGKSVKKMIVVTAARKPVISLVETGTAAPDAKSLFRKWNESID